MSDTYEPILRAMAVRSAGGSTWQHVDGTTCLAAAEEIKSLRSDCEVLADLVERYSQAEQPEALVALAADRDKWWRLAVRSEMLDRTLLQAVEAEEAAFRALADQDLTRTNQADPARADELLAASVRRDLALQALDAAALRRGVAERELLRQARHRAEQARETAVP